MQDKLNSNRCAEYLKALADPERLRIVQCLQDGPCDVGEISRKMESAYANVSHHLKQLRIRGLVCSHKEGRRVVYELSPALARRQDHSSLNVLDFGCCRIELGRKMSGHPR